MAIKYIEIIASTDSAKTIQAIAERVKAVDFRQGEACEDSMQQMRMLVEEENLQLALDALQNVLGAQPTARIVVLAVEASLPKEEEEEEEPKDSVTAARELLYEQVERGARLDSNFALLVILSTIVAAIGLIENNIAVVIGAMVIAPLLGPNLALSLGTALGDVPLMRKSAQSLLVGVALAVILSAPFGYFWPGELNSTALMERTSASLDSIALALASGAAAALSLTTGLSGVLVGVMVAVALLPPAATFGIMLGDGHPGLATGAGLLLAVNIVSINLASKLVFILKGIHPRTWMEKTQAARAMRRYVAAWILTLLVLLVLIYLRRP